LLQGMNFLSIERRRNPPPHVAVSWGYRDATRRFQRSRRMLRSFRGCSSQIPLATSVPTRVDNMPRGVAILLAGGNIGAGYGLPDQGVDRRKQGVAVDFSQYMRDIQPVSHRQSLIVYLATPDDADFIG